MAIAAEDLAGAAAAAGRGAAGAGRRAVNRAATFGSPGGSPAATTVIRLIWAGAAFLIGLELASFLSGQYFSWDLRQGASRLKDAGGYLGLYPGQQAKIAGQLPTTLGPAYSGSTVGQRQQDLAAQGLPHAAGPLP